MAQIFLSYSYSDSDFVELIEPRIARIFGEGVLWYDRKPDGLKGGQIWWDEIRRQVQRCQIFMYLMSDSSVSSHWCMKELEEAASLNKTLIPVLLETYSSKDYPAFFSKDVQLRLEQTQYVDLRNYSRFPYGDLSGLWGAINRSKRPNLTPSERWLLYNQYEILKVLNNRDRRESRFETETQNVIVSGYELALVRMMQSFEEGMSFNDCKEVEDILNMFHSIDLARRDFWEIGIEFDFDEANLFTLRFKGFDGNFESQQMQYAKYLINDCRSFETVKPSNGDFNSGSPQLPQFRRMLSAWRKSRDELKLTDEDLERILDSVKNSGNDLQTWGQWQSQFLK